MSDVARLAGVSQSTVSLVVNGHPGRVGAATRARVLAAIEKLGFRPNLTARGLRLSSTGTIGLVTDLIASSPFAGPIVSGAQALAWSHDQLLLVVNTDGDEDLKVAAVQALLDRRVDGLLYAAMAWQEVRLPATFRTVPSLLVNAWSADGHPAVVPAEVEGGRLAARAVLEAGHRRIALVGGLASSAAAVEREQGFRECLAAAGIAPVEAWISGGPWDIESGYRRATALLDRAGGPGDRPTAVVCGNDLVAVGVITACRDAGLRVPDDVSVVGYDDQPILAAQFRPGLTTVSIPHDALGRAAVSALMTSLGTGRPPVGTRIGGVLVQRGSVGPPPPD